MEKPHRNWCEICHRLIAGGQTLSHSVTPYHRKRLIKHMKKMKKDQK